MTELNKTPLHAAHLALNARMVDFGGWDMPVNYGSQIDEHQAVRGAAGMFDVSHMCTLDVAGPRAGDFLKYAVANNVEKLRAPGRALYSCMLNPAGGVVDDLIIYFFGDAAFRVVVNAATATKDLAWLTALNHQHGFGVSLTPRRDLALLAVQGPLARAKVWQAVPGSQATTEALKPFYATRLTATPFGELMVAHTGYTGEDGFELTVPAGQVEALWQALLAAGVQPCGLGARDTLRLEAGMNLYGQDMDDSVSPLDAGLAWTVDLATERDFVGRAALAANGATHAFVGLILRDSGGVLRAHQRVITPYGDGEITSGTFSPTLHASIAFARVPLEVQPGATVQVQIRDRHLAASVVKLPFVRHGKVLVA